MQIVLSFDSLIRTYTIFFLCIFSLNKYYFYLNKLPKVCLHLSCVLYTTTIHTMYDAGLPPQSYFLYYLHVYLCVCWIYCCSCCFCCADAANTPVLLFAIVATSKHLYSFTQRKCFFISCVINFDRMNDLVFYNIIFQ